jgi:hypothetical protein
MARRPHLVFFPFPAQGHVTPASQLARLLHRRHGFDITFVHTEAPPPRARAGRAGRSPGVPLRCRPRRPAPVRRGRGAGQDRPVVDLSLEFVVSHLKNLLLSDSDLAAARCCVISDVDLVLRAVAEMGLPCVTFWTTCASSFMAWQQCQQLVAKGLVPLRGR